MKTLFLQAPSFEGFDGGAGSRYQAKREVKSFWFPTWLAQPAALVPDSRLLDAPADGLTVAEALEIARGYELVIMHTSTPSFPTDAKFAELLKQDNPQHPDRPGRRQDHGRPGRLAEGHPAVDFVCREEFDYTCKEVAEGTAARRTSRACPTAAPTAASCTTCRAPIIENMDELPFVAPVYQRDLKIENYFIGYLKHPYVSFYTGRGCRSKCTFCLWPQTVGGHRYRVRSAENVIAEVKWIKENMPEVKEIMFDDDTFTDSSNLPRVEAIARGMGELGMTWSCNAKANVPYKTLKVMKDNGLRLLLVGYESGDDQILHNIKKGLRTDIARRFTEDCRKLGILIHGTFILGLPGETTRDHREDHPVRQGDQSAHHPGVARRALSRHHAVPAGGRERLAAGERCRQPGQRPGRAAGRDQLSAPVEGRDLPQHGSVLQALLFPSRQDLGDRRGDAGELGHDEAAPARGRRVLPLPARARRPEIARRIMPGPFMPLSRSSAGSPAWLCAGHGADRGRSSGDSRRVPRATRRRHCRR